ncbi:flagellar biosynthesis protein [Pullulanibacillus pueri]|uniref:Type III secretion protein n=1 Tax=Pullulanibacillus pueri TaxID=1437324 RepID=A0A8J2ZSB2_9BACL|nr:EscU/YscU/HrcU family type III secretion system export apparatus switch protein [Pullulanibacillus pueri]MBM7680216.1 flagellar biosynthesis protein [Pullulanibacillus pueri]GGH74935.1 type III secretion protein [Pullulanibacillus pueri]
MSDVQKKIKKAVALSYQSERDIAPKLSAKGMNNLAEKIIEKAEQHNIPIQKDDTLVALLSTLEIGESIPPELYEAVAEIFNFVYALNREFTPNPNQGED